MEGRILIIVVTEIDVPDAHFVPTGLWSGLVVCVFSQALSYLIYIMRTNWNRVAEQVTVSTSS